MARVQCPDCGEPLEVHGDLVGPVVSCPSCASSFTTLSPDTDVGDRIPPAIVWLMLGAGHVLALLLLLAIAGYAVGLSIVSAVAVLSVAVWQRRRLPSLVRRLAPVLRRLGVLAIATFSWIGRTLRSGFTPRPQPSAGQARKLQPVLPAAGGVRHFHTKVVGVTHDNPDGTRRQRIIRRCRVLERLVLDHEQDNPHDANAVRICRASGEQLGYLRAELAEEIVNESSRGYRYAVFVKDLTGGTRDAPTRGVNLIVVVAEPGVSDQEAQAYVGTLDLEK